MITEQDKFDKVKAKLDNVLEQITADEIEERINVDEQETIERLEKLVKLRKNKAGKIKYDNCICATEDIETVLSMLKQKDKQIEKKDKIMDLMAEQIKIAEPTMLIVSLDIKPRTKFGIRYLNKEEIKQYFEKKVEEWKN